MKNEQYDEKEVSEVYEALLKIVLAASEDMSKLKRGESCTVICLNAENANCEACTNGSNFRWKVRIYGEEA